MSPRPLAALALPLAALLATALPACSGPIQKQVKLNRWGQPTKEGQPPPPWVERLPESTKERIYAVGFCAPTFWPQDAMNNAAEDARGKLALALSSKVERVSQSVDQSDSQRRLDITKEATDLVMQNSRIEVLWVDEAGARSEAGSVWALAAIDRNGARPDGGGHRPSGSGGPGESGADGGTARAPGWLDRLPTHPARLYAAGYSGPTFRPEDALQYAGDAAITNLANSLRSHVQAYNLVVATGSGQTIDDFARLDDPDAAFLELVRKSAKVEQLWVDAEGTRPGDPPGSVWALATIEVGNGNTKGGFQTQQNDDTGPALDARGNAR